MKWIPQSTCLTHPSHHVVTFFVWVVGILKVFLWFHTTYLDFKSGLTILRTDQSGSLCLQTMQTIQFMMDLYFPSGSMGFGYELGRGCLHNQSPVNILGSEPLMSFPGREHFTCIVRNPWGIKLSYVWLHWEGIPGKFELVFAELHPCAFSLCWLCLVSFQGNKP